MFLRTYPHIVKPTEVRIIEPIQNMTVGQRVELVCQSSGSRPPAKITWKKNQKLLEHYSESTSDDGTVTTNFLTFVPTKEDDGKLLACMAFNPQFSDFRIEDSLHLDVHCNYWTHSMTSCHTYSPFTLHLLFCLYSLSPSVSPFFPFLMDLNRSWPTPLLDAPILSLLLGASIQRQEILEGSDVYFDCNIQVSFQLFNITSRSILNTRIYI